MALPAESASRLTQAERSAASDDAMLCAAAKLIRKNGVHKTTLAMIGEQAGYSRGLASYRFGTKGGLLDALCKSISQRWVEYLDRSIGTTSGIAAMCAALDAYELFSRERPADAELLQILVSVAGSPVSDFRETISALFDRQASDVERWVRDGQRSGDIRSDVDPRAAANQFIAYISGAASRSLFANEQFDLAHTNAEMQRQLRASLSA